MKDQIKAVVAVLMVGALGYVLYTELSGSTLIPGGSSTAAPPEPDYTKLAALKEVKSVQAVAVLGGTPSYDMGGRNLFQFGPPKPPPPTPAALEAMRKIEEARLKAMEEEARKRAEEQQKAQAENEKRIREQQEAADAQKKVAEAQQPAAKPAPAPKPPPPPITYKLVGWLGPSSRRIAVLLNGKDIVLARKGEVIEGKFKLIGMGAESVEMGYVDPSHADVTKRIDLGS